MNLRTDLDGTKNLASAGIRCHDPPARNEPLYRQRYPGRHLCAPKAKQLHRCQYCYEKREQTVPIYTYKGNCCFKLYCCKPVVVEFCYVMLYYVPGNK